MQATQSLTEDYAVPKAHSKAGRISTSGKPAGRQCGIPGLCQSRRPHNHPNQHTEAELILASPSPLLSSAASFTTVPLSTSRVNPIASKNPRNSCARNNRSSTIFSPPISYIFSSPFSCTNAATERTRSASIFPTLSFPWTISLSKSLSTTAAPTTFL